jgi:levansucrase
MRFKFSRFSCVAAFVLALPMISDARAEQPQFTFPGSKLSIWTLAAASKMKLTPELTIPVFPTPDRRFSDTYHLWDAWPVRNRAGAIATIDGRQIMISLSAPRGQFETKFYTRSKWRYWTRKAGEPWVYGGLVFADGDALGSRQWAGSTVYDETTGEIEFYYTAVGKLRGGKPSDVDTSHRSGHPGFGRPPTTQRMVLARATVRSSASGVTFEAIGSHRVILEADGRLYQTEDQYPANKVVYGMRDPWVFQHPETDRTCVLFTANTSYFDGASNGAVGLGCRTKDTATDGQPEWRLHEPILATAKVSAQLERPHLVRTVQGLYLFFSTHGFLFPSEIENGPKEGLFGFYAPTGKLNGPWLPLNGHGLVAGNPPAQPLQTYSYLVLPSLDVTSYLNKPVGLMAKFPDGADWLGSPAPVFSLKLDRTRAWIAGTREEQVRPD